MPTDCTPNFFEFAPVEGRKVVAAFDAGPVTSDAGALLLGATDRAIGMMKRFACCFDDVRRPDLIEHEVVTLVGQRVFGIALGYEDLNDHDELRHDPMMAILAGKLAARCCCTRSFIPLVFRIVTAASGCWPRCSVNFRFSQNCSPIAPTPDQSSILRSAKSYPTSKTEIVRRSDRAKGFVPLPKRWIVERTLAWLNRCRRLAKDWENLNRSALAFLKLASIRLMLRKLCNP